MPLCEELLNVTDKTFSTPYRLTGHEKDEESGLHYVHARYLSTDLSIFLSVDPMYMKYLALTPYHYCGNNPVARVDPSGMYFNEENEVKASKIELSLDKKIYSLQKRYDSMSAKRKANSDINERITELKKSKTDIQDMRSDKSNEYRYLQATSKMNPAGRCNPLAEAVGTNETGDQIIGLFVTSGTSNKLHESRHGGQHARGEINIVTKEGYDLSSEVSAYRAQYSWDGKLQYNPYVNLDVVDNMNHYLQSGSVFFQIKIKNISLITVEMLRTMVDNPGPNQRLIYP